MSRRRVVFTGTAGFSGSKLVQKLADHIEKDSGNKVRVIEVEKSSRDKGDSPYFDFLDSLHKPEAAEEWLNSFYVAFGAWKKEIKENGEPDFTFLSLHLVYQFRGHFYCPLNWKFLTTEFVHEKFDVKYGSVVDKLQSLLREFKPDLFINLYDNVYSIQHRIEKYPFRMVELLRWRNLEMLMTDVVADLVIPQTPERRTDPRDAPKQIEKYRYERSPTVAIQHPIDMVSKLIMQPETNRIYMAYPITKPREIERATGDKSMMKEINEFRQTMSQHFIAFDPVTIDERPLKYLWDDFLTYIGSRLALLSKNFNDSKDIADLCKVRDFLYRSLFTNDDTVHVKDRPDLTEKLKKELSEFVEGLSEHLTGESDLRRRVTRQQLTKELVDTTEYLLGRKKLRLRTDSLWPTENDEYKRMLCGCLERIKSYDLDATEIREIVEEKHFSLSTKKGGEVDNQIVQRDYRLIDQADGVMIYRPTFNKAHWEYGGTLSEYLHAKEEMDKPTIIIRDVGKVKGEDIDGKLDKGGFVTKATPFDIVEGENLTEDGDERRRCLNEAIHKMNEQIKVALSGK